MNTKKQAILAAAAFLLLASAITLLFTTEKGGKIRKSAKEKGKEIIDDLKDKVS